MPRGKKQLSRPSAGGIVRNDHHRRNRKENKSTHRTSFGRQVPLAHGLRFEELRKAIGDRYHLPRLDDIQSESAENVEITIIANIHRVHLTELAGEWWNVRHGFKPNDPRWRQRGNTPPSVCVQYARHALTNYDEIRSGYIGAAYITIACRIYQLIADTYPWLAIDCGIRIEEVKNLRVVKGRDRIARTKSLSASHLEEMNEPEYQPSGFIGEDDGTFPIPLTSLASDRLLYLPPFLKRTEIKQRRFGGGVDMNDQWWEWEQEKDINPPEREQRFHWMT